MYRITRTHLNALAQRLNVLTKSPAQPYGWNSDGTHCANIGNFHIDGAYGGYCLHRMMNESGGVTMHMGHAGHVPARELYEQMRAFIAGIEFARSEGAVSMLHGISHSLQDVRNGTGWPKDARFVLVRGE